MIIYSKRFRGMILLLWVMMLVTACTTSFLSGVTAPPPTATLLSAATPSPTATSTPATSTHTPTPTATPDPAATCRALGENGRIFVISDEELQEHHGHYLAKEAFREAIRIYYPAWAEYSQQLTFGKMVVTHDLATIIWDAGGECWERCPYPISVNPSVILAILILKYGEVPPPGFDAYQAVRQIALDIKRLYEESQAQPKVWQDHFANVSSYVVYKVVKQNMEQLQQWCVTYHTVYHTFSLIWQAMRP